MHLTRAETIDTDQILVEIGSAGGGAASAIVFSVFCGFLVSLIS